MVGFFYFLQFMLKIKKDGRRIFFVSLYPDFYLYYSKMNKTTKQKALVLSLMVLLGLIPLTAFAQQLSDGFFQSWENSDFIRESSWTFTVHTQDFSESPVGSGLIILTAVGAGYAMVKRRRAKRNLKKSTALLLASLTLLGMTGCRKNVETITSADETVHITVKVNDDDKAFVNPSTGHVTFCDGDIMYVGYNGAKVGQLTCSDGYLFSGDISIMESGDQPLYLYYMGGQAATYVDATHYTANISDQANNSSGIYPVIASGPSSTNYTVGIHDYYVDMTNKCGFVKFGTNVKNGTVTVGGMNTVATVNFETGEITPGTVGNVNIKTDEYGVGWAILLPQAAVNDATVSSAGYLDGTCDVPEITNNLLYSHGVVVSLVYAVTWNSTIINGINLSSNFDHTNVAGGVTATLLTSGDDAYWTGGSIRLSAFDVIQFESNNSKSFSKIEISCTGCENLREKDGWSYDGESHKVIWQGVQTTSLEMQSEQNYNYLNITGITQIDFTMVN